MTKTANTIVWLFLLGLFLSCENEDTNEGNIIEENPPTVYEGWTLQWNDEFNDPDINANNWGYELGDGTDYGLPVGWGNNEKQIYTDHSENSSIVNDQGVSALAITARKESSGGYTSAKLTTQNLFSMRFGRIEIRAKMPRGQGLLPAIWMLGDNIDQIDWPGCGEIDIVEVLGHAPLKAYSTLHFTNDENKHGEKQNSHILESGAFSKSYHIFTLDWTPDSLSFSVDGEQLGEVMIEGDMKEFLRSSYLILNVAVGGNWPGEPDDTTVFPQTMYTDYIRVYTKNDFQAPEAPALDIVEETVGQILEPNIGDHAIKEGFTDLGNITVIPYGPGAPDISSSDTAIDGDQSLVFDFPGGNWGGAYIQMETPKDISAYTHLKFSINKPEAYVNSEIKLEAGASNAVVFLKDYTGAELANGFVEYAIPLSDFSGLELTGLTIPFGVWNPQDSNNEFIQGNVLIDKIHFSN